MSTPLHSLLHPARAAWLAAALFAGAAPVHAQEAQPAAASAQPVVLTLEEAVQIARVQSYAIRNLRLDVENAEAQVREAYSAVYPQANVSSSYTRNLVQANPFAGSSAGGLFQSLGFIDWLAYNERARTDDNPATDPISAGEFFDRQQQGLEAAGIQLDAGANPFGVENQFVTGLSVEQAIYNQSAFAAIKGAEALRKINERAVDRQEQVLVNQVQQAFLQALLAQEQADVTQQSAARTRQTLQDVSRQVVQGVVPVAQRLGVEVQLANLETQLLQAQNQASLAVDNLKFTLGVPVEQPVVLRGTLDAGNTAELLTVSVDDAVAAALENRPDLEQARLAIELNQVNRDITRAQYYPIVSAFLNANYLGSVPDNRSFTVSDPNDPFQFTQNSNSFFNGSYWNPSVSAGLRLTWNIFNGWRTSARVQQNTVAIRQAEINAQQALQSVRLDVQRAMNNLQAARQRIQAQEQNVGRAERNYQFARARLGEGVASQLEEREASEQLDQSRLLYLQAAYDYLVARSGFETAIGAPIPANGPVRLTSSTE